MRYVEDRDLWRWELPASRAVNATIRSYDMTFPTLNRLSFLEPMDLVIEGIAILRAQQQVINQHIRHAYEVGLAGYLVPCVNATVHISEIAGALAVGKPFAICWFENAEGKRIFSLRSDENGVDVSRIAKLYGGGGHKHAAGFTIDAPVPLLLPDGRVGQMSADMAALERSALAAAKFDIRFKITEE